MMSQSQCASENVFWLIMLNEVNSVRIDIHLLFLDNIYFSNNECMRVMLEARYIANLI